MVGSWVKMIVARFAAVTRYAAVAASVAVLTPVFAAEFVLAVAAGAAMTRFPAVFTFHIFALLI